MDVKKFEAPAGFLDVRRFLNTWQVKQTPRNQLLGLEMWNVVNKPFLGRLTENLVSGESGLSQSPGKRAMHPAPPCPTPPCPNFSFRRALSGPKTAPRGTCGSRDAASSRDADPGQGGRRASSCVTSSRRAAAETRAGTTTLTAPEPPGPGRRWRRLGSS